MVRATSIGLSLFVTVGAVVGASSLIADPTGASLGMDLSALEYSPFATFLVPGLVLVVVVGGSQLLAALTQVRWTRRAPMVSIGAGVLLLGWLVVQVVLIRQLHVLHALFGVIAIIEVVLGFVGLGHAAPHSADTAATAFLAHERVAFVGLSPRAGEFSGYVAKELRARGHDVVGINPRAAAAGEPEFHANLRDLADPPRAALVMVPRDRAADVVEDCIAAGVETVWFHRGAGPGSATPEAVARARAARIEVVTDVCPMMFLEDAGWIHRAHRRLSATG